MSDTEVRNETRDERRSADRRQAEQESMRINPEVMGRKEPDAIERESRESEMRTQPTQMARNQAPAEHMDFWPPMGDFMHRLEDIQAEFINEPRGAVKKAEKLVEEAVDHMAKSMHEHVKRMHGDVEGNADTERLRLVMRSYRTFIESLDSRRAA